jgi:hypothetical protein
MLQYSSEFTGGCRGGWRIVIQVRREKRVAARVAASEASRKRIVNGFVNVE